MTIYKPFHLYYVVNCRLYNPEIAFGDFSGIKGNLSVKSRCSVQLPNNISNAGSYAPKGLFGSVSLNVIRCKAYLAHDKSRHLSCATSNLERDTSKVRFDGALVPWTNSGFGDNRVRTFLKIGISKSLADSI